MAKKTGNRALPTRALIEEANKTQRILERKSKDWKDTAAIHFRQTSEHTRAGKRRQRQHRAGVEEGRARVASSSDSREAREVICVSLAVQRKLGT